MASKDWIQKLYVAYFGRPADVAGLNYWTGLLDDPNSGVTQMDVLHAVSISEESKALYGGSSADNISKMYQVLFGRAPDIDGLNYWVGQIDAGKVVAAEVAATIMESAITDPKGTQGAADKQAIENKLAAATLFTDNLALRPADEQAIYEEVGGTALESGRSFLAGVTDTSPATEEQIQTAVDEIIAPEPEPTPEPAPTPGGGSSGGGGTVVSKTYTLTTDTDNFTGTAGNDTFVGDNTTTQAGDSLDGGAGTDTLKLTGLDNPAKMPTITGIENIELINIPGEGSFDFSSNYDDVKSVKLDGATARVTITVAAGQSVTLANSNAGADIATTTANTSLDVTLNKVGNSTSPAPIVFAGDTLTTVDLTVAGDSTIDVTNTGGQLSTLNISGAGAIDLSGGNVALPNTITAVNAAAASGDIAVKLANTVTNVTTGTGSDNVTVTGGALAADANVNLGAGDDKLTLDTAPNAGATLNGGEGTDTIAVASANVGSNISDVISQFEVLEVTDALNADLDVANFDNIQRVVLGGAAGTQTISGLASGATVTYTTENTGKTSTLEVTGTTGTDELNLVFNPPANIDFGTVAAAGVETVNIESTATATTQGEGTNTLALNAANATTVAVTGNANLSLTENTLAALTTFNAAAASGDITVKLANTVTNVTTGTGSDDVTVTGELAADANVNLGVGDDKLTLDTEQAEGATSETEPDEGTIPETEPTTGATLDGGAGSDTLVATSAALASTAVFKNFETIEVTDELDAYLDVSKFGDVNHVVLADGATYNGSISGLKSGATVTLSSWSQAPYVLNVSNADNANNDELNLVLKMAYPSNFGGVQANNVETVNIDSTTTATELADVTNELHLDATAATTVVVTGNVGLYLTTTNSNAINNFDASGATGGVSFTSANTGEVTITGGAGDDYLTGNDGADTIAGGAGADNITLGEGTDTLIFNSLTGTDTIDDYDVANDRIELSKTVFGELTTDVGNALGAAEFESGEGMTAAATAEGRIIYDTTSGNLYYDADGNAASGTAAVLIATFTNKPNLVATEFSITY